MDTEESPAPSAHDISLKITNLKTYYCSTKAKYESAMKSGAGVDDIPTIRWPFYKMLSFLNNNGTGRTFRERETLKKSKKETKSDHYDNLINEEREMLDVACNLVKDQNQSKDSNNQSQGTHPDDLFCQVLATQLKKSKGGAFKRKIKNGLASSNVRSAPPPPHQKHLFIRIAILITPLPHPFHHNKHLMHLVYQIIMHHSVHQFIITLL